MVQTDNRQSGFSHVMVLALVLVGFALVGTYMLMKSHAGTSFAGCTQRGTVKFAFSAQSGAGVYTKPYYQTLSQSRTNNKTCVRSLQYRVGLWCRAATEPAVDGNYGPATAKAVRNIQAKAKSRGWRADSRAIVVDGITGPQTWAILQAYTPGVMDRANCKA